MPNRFQQKQYEFIYRYLVARDGEHCIICGRKPPQIKLEIDHADNNPVNNDPDNLHLLCRRDNLRMRQVTAATHRRTIAKYSLINVSQREDISGSPSTKMVKDLVDYRSGSVEMQANSYFENSFREWVLQAISSSGFIPKKEAINGGAEAVGCSPTSTARYLGKLTSSMGNLKEVTTKLGVLIVKR